MTDQLRDKDRIVLQRIKEGDDDVQKITSATTLENHHVRYCFEKLEDLELIQVTKPDEMVERVIRGQKRVFQHPKQAELTAKGEEYLETAREQDLDQYENLTHRELVQKVHELEGKTEELEQNFETFRRQVKELI